MADRVTKKSRNVGSRKPGRPPKNKKADTPPVIPASDWGESSSTDWGAEFDKGIGTIALPGMSPAPATAATQNNPPREG